jgi:hypothetical protein
MVWAPRANVIDLTQIADNLLAYIADNQTDALIWANGGTGLDDFAKFYTNAVGRLQTQFPSLMILTQRAEPDLSGEILLSRLEVTLEGTIAGNETDTLVRDAKIYAKAVESMIMNIPPETLTANSDPEMHAAFIEQLSVLDILRPHSSGFMQIFQTQCVYRLTADAY